MQRTLSHYRKTDKQYIVSSKILKQNFNIRIFLFAQIVFDLWLQNAKFKAGQTFKGKCRDFINKNSPGAAGRGWGILSV